MCIFGGRPQAKKQDDTNTPDDTAAPVDVSPDGVPTPAGSGDVAPPPRTQEQVLPNRRDTLAAQERAAVRRQRATKTLLTQDNTIVDKSKKKTLLGA